MTCPGCKEEFDDFNHRMRYNKALDIAVCEKCDEKIDNHHLVDGKYIIHKCKCCGNIDKLEWVSYKKRGHPVGVKNKKTLEKIDKEREAQKRLTKWTEEPKTLEEFAIW
ncbi:MAG: hypothetical protein PHW62_00335 [Candidatus Ratteibacteria bacterium]|nr:hypothetical protein [Candidatus Ratteibacteria bacterium]